MSNNHKFINKILNHKSRNYMWAFDFDFPLLDALWISISLFKTRETSENRRTVNNGRPVGPNVPRQNSNTFQLYHKPISFGSEMKTIHLLDSNTTNIPNVHNLILFDGHLFSDGYFRMIDILYDPNVIDDQCLSQLESICFDPIPKTLADISRPLFPLWKLNERDDSTLQLIFLSVKWNRSISKIF